nr:hypothetical protein [Tanacetum cinerariifolium]
MGEGVLAHEVPSPFPSSSSSSSLRWEEDGWLKAEEEEVEVRDPNSSLGKICLEENVVEISSDKVEVSGDWNSLEFQNTANSVKNKETKAMVFHQMDTEEVSDRFVAPCFVNGLKAYDGEINLGVEENMILNEYAVKFCLEHEFIINPDKNDVEPGVILGRSFIRMTKAITDFGTGTVIIYPEFDLFLEDIEEEEKSLDDWDHLLDFNLVDVPLLGGEELSPFVCKIEKSSHNKKRAMENLNLFYQDIGTSSSAGGHLTQEDAIKEALTIRISQTFALLKEERPVIETMAYHDKYKKILNEIWKDNVELDEKIIKENEEAVKRIKREALKEKDDPEALWEHTMMRPDHQDLNDPDNMKLWKRYYSRKFIMNSCYGNNTTEMRSLGIYQAVELDEEGFNVNFEGVECTSCYNIRSNEDSCSSELFAIEFGINMFPYVYIMNSELISTKTATWDALLHYDAEIEVMNLILLSIPNDIYNSMDACTSAKDMWKRVECLMRGTIQNKVDRETRFTNEFDQFVAEPGEALVSVYNRFAQLMKDLERNDMHFPIVTINTKFMNNLQLKWLKYDDIQTNPKDPLASAMLLLARAITQKFSNPTNNRLRTSSNTRNQAIIQGDRVNIQSKNSGNTRRNNRRAYVQEEAVEGSNETENVQRNLLISSSGNTSTVQCYNCSGKGHHARNCPKPRVRDSKYFMEQMLLAKQDEAGVILTDEQNYFLFADASRLEEIEDLNANICLMARIQPNNNISDVGPSYDSAFISEVQSLSINENKEQMYLTHTKIIDSTIGDDLIDSNIIFDTPNGNVNSGSVEKDTHVRDLYALEQLARNAYQEAEKQQIFAQKVQEQNTTLTSQLDLYKERVRVLENINEDNNYLNEFLEADKRAKHFDQQAQSQFIRDRDII